MKYKKLKGEEQTEYDCNYCAVDKCNNASEIIDATLKHCSVRLPLCEHHWKQRCEKEIENEN